ncbi:hypothetical protein [Desulfogranum marinum]|uniref:hypothetical protein n=1 Tax=Desulfogranum marinum TaxID=453220 RepID=UPI0029C7DB3A|nr:hypothetical protein [Desulfogranum marinum]
MTTQKLTFNQMRIKGKIIAIETAGKDQDKTYYHQLALPGKDEYDSPSGIIVSSSKMLGGEDQVVELTAEFSGYLKRVRYFDKDTGEQKEFMQRNYYFKEVAASA